MNTLSEIAPSIFANPAPQPSRHGASGSRMFWWLAWQERRFAAKRCKELLALHARVSEERPLLQPEARYREVVLRRVHCTEMQADELLECARDSYAEWPVRRALRLRDVAHFLVVCEYCATHEGAEWVLGALGDVVDHSIPRQL